MMIPFDEHTFELSQKVHNILVHFVRSSNIKSSIARRSNYILLASEGKTIASISSEMKSDRDTVSLWVNRFMYHMEYLDNLANDCPDDLDQAILETLSDMPRCGAPVVYSEEIRKLVVFLCCHEVCDFDIVANR